MDGRPLRRLGGGSVPRSDGLIPTHNGLLTAAATVAIAVLTYYVVRFTAEQGMITNRQLSIMETDQRPWIKIETIEAISPLTFKTDGVEVGGGVKLLFNLQNVGKSPALKPMIDTRLAFDADLPDRQRKYCADIKRHRIGAAHGLQPENTIFPTDKASIESLAWSQRDDMKEVLEWAANSPDNKSNNLAVIGCIFYDFTFVDGPHQTGIMLRLTKRTLYPDNTKPAWYSKIPSDKFEPNMVSYNPYHFSKGIRLDGEIRADDLDLNRPVEGFGPVD
jgi:hypothetical protein